MATTTTKRQSTKGYGRTENYFRNLWNGSAAVVAVFTRRFESGLGIDGVYNHDDHEIEKYFVAKQ